MSALNSALDRVEHHLAERDYVTADVAGAVVRKLLAHPRAGLYSLRLDWRRMLARWERLHTRLGAPPTMLVDLIEHHASVLLIEAARAAGNTR